MSQRDELARILAICDDYDGCFERVDEWEATPEDERRDDDYPASDYEDCQWWLRRADAALELLRPRVVETDGVGALETLWTMPVGTTIECGSGMLWRKVATGMYGWVGTGVSHHCQPEVFMRDTPLTVLSLPEEKP